MSWNATCVVSNLHIKSGAPTVALLMLKNEKPSANNCYANAYFNPCLLPFYGKYDGHGGVLECTGPGLPYLCSALEHDIYEVKTKDYYLASDSFSLEDMFKANLDQNLGLRAQKKHNEESRIIYEYTARQKKGYIMTPSEKMQYESALNTLEEDSCFFQQLKLVHIHFDIFADILRGYTINHKHYSDIVEVLPHLVSKLKKGAPLWQALTFEEEVDNLSWLIIELLFSSSMDLKPVVMDMRVLLQELIDKNATSEHIIEVFAEALKIYWVNAFMNQTRKIWILPSGEGTENDSHKSYELLLGSMQKVLAEEKNHWEEWQKIMYEKEG